MKILLFKRILVLFICALLAYPSEAGHIIGGEMTYICFGDDPNIPGNKLYLFTLTVYRDNIGTGAQFDNPATVSVFEGNDNDEKYNFEFEDPDIEELDPETGNACIMVPPNVGVERGVYTLLRSLPIINETYYIVYQRCCRNGTITNIVDPADQGSTYFVELTPKAQNECNNTPVFKEFPPIVICANKALEFDHSATDAEGDQLVYEFCNPVDGGSMTTPAPNPDQPPPYDPIIFTVSQFTFDSPVGGNPEVAIDPLTGLITGTPDIQGQFVVGICVKEFRAGELLSTIQRNFQFNVTFCEDLITAGVNGVDLGDNYYFESCVDSTFNIINQTTTAQGVTINEYLWEFDLINQGTGLPLSFDQKDITVTFPGPGIYTGTMTVNPNDICSDVANILVEIHPPIDPFFEYAYDTCVAGPVEFFDMTLMQGLGDTSWFWDFGDGGTSREVNPMHMYQTPGIKTVTMSVTDVNGCVESFVQNFNWQPVPPVIIIDPSTAIGCPPEDIFFNNLSTPVDSTYEIIWNFGDGGIENAVSPNHVYEVPDTYTVSVEITSPIGCFTSDSFENLIFIDSLPVAEFIFDPTEGTSNFFPEVNFMDLSSRAVAWDWKFSEFDSTILQNPTYIFPDTGKQEVKLLITSLYGCVDSISHIVDVVPKVTYYLPNAFTPNNDGLNEDFRAKGFFRGITNFDMRIWNRWGEVVFETNDPRAGWNGQKGNVGKLAPNGVYVVRVTYIGPRGHFREYKGFATVVR